MIQSLFLVYEYQVLILQQLYADIEWMSGDTPLLNAFSNQYMWDKKDNRRSDQYDCATVLQMITILLVLYLHSAIVLLPQMLQRVTAQ